MPSAAIQARSSRSIASPLFESAETGSRVRPRPRFASGFLLVLTRLAGGAAGGGPDAAAETPTPACLPENRCEFDYDYYVTLQSRRRHRASQSRLVPKTDRHA